MTSKPVAFLLADLGVTKTHSRPHVSNDNPYSEAQFKTLKYRPGLPRPLRLDRGRPGVLPDLLPLVQHEHRHSGLGLHTAADVHYGTGRCDPRAAAPASSAAAYQAHPERFVRKPPEPPRLPGTAWINKPTQKEDAAQ